MNHPVKIIVDWNLLRIMIRAAIREGMIKAQLLPITENSPTSAECVETEVMIAIRTAVLSTVFVTVDENTEKP